MTYPILPAALAQVHDHANLNQILHAVRTHLGMEIGFISEFVDGCRVFRHVESAEGKACIEVGGSDPLEESYCHWVVQGKLPRLIQDPADHPLTAQFAVTRSLPVGAHLSVPIRLRDGQVYGTFCCFSFAPDLSLTARDLATIEAFADVAAQQIQQVIDASEERETKSARIRTVIGGRNLQIVFQPALRLDTGGAEFIEALARFPSEPRQSPDKWFAAAAEVGLGAELELLAMAEAIGHLPDLVGGLTMSLNVSPDTILTDGFEDVLARAPLDRIIIEITEHETVKRYAEMNGKLAPLRERGLRIAVDDVGAGYSSLRHILQIRPDLIKLDMSLAQGIDRDPARRALAAALISFSRDIGSVLVAEGVETNGELDTLRALGVNLVQGFLVGRPLPLSVQPQLLAASR